MVGDSIRGLIEEDYCHLDIVRGLEVLIGGYLCLEGTLKVETFGICTHQVDVHPQPH